METVLSLLSRFKYAAMFGILVLCGLGLPLPEEVTLIGSGLAVGWKEASFLPASIACVMGILVGDSIVFALGRYWGKPFLASRPMRFFLSPRRQVKVQRLFSRHGSKAVFFARFFAGIRLGVYAYAGQHGMSWVRFLLLDFLGALISGPTSIWIGKFAAERIADPEDARELAEHIFARGQHWVYAGLAALVLIVVAHWLWMGREARRRRDPEAPPDEAAAPRSRGAPGGSEEGGLDSR